MLLKLIKLLANKLILDYQLKRIENKKENLKEKETKIMAKLDNEILGYNNKVK
ncbi:MAG: hypothetical protein QNJ64_06900 [Crocosphaera sp.]|nr:hypothetical protein [Crocosphaera sp.]